MLLLPADGT